MRTTSVSGISIFGLRFAPIGRREVRTVKTLFLLLLLALSLQAGAAENGNEALPSCPLLFTAVPAKDYIAVLRKHELTANSLKLAEGRLMEHLYNLLLQIPRGDIASQAPDLVRSFSGAVSAHVRGWDEFAGEFEAKIAAKLGVQRTLVERAAKLAAEDPIVYRSSSMAEFILQGAPTIEGFLLGLMLREDISKLQFVRELVDGKKVSAPFVPGPRQIEMIRSVLQYSLTRPGESVLEIGYGTPAVSLGLAHFTRAKVFAIDLVSPPMQAPEILRKYGVELVHGVFPTSKKGIQRLRENAPFSVILALDTLKDRGGVLKTDLAPTAFIASIYNLLAPGGTLVILNDFKGEPNFSERDAIKAGFDIIRWRFIETVPEELVRMMPYQTHVDAGQLALYVLRKGDPPMGKARLVQSVLDRSE